MKLNMKLINETINLITSKLKTPQTRNKELENLKDYVRSSVLFVGDKKKIYKKINKYKL